MERCVWVLELMGEWESTVREGEEVEGFEQASESAVLAFVLSTSRRKQKKTA